LKALVHISEVGDGEGGEPEQVFKLDLEQEFEVIDVNKRNQKDVPGSAWRSEG
jgi:ribosomal protein S1